MLKGAIFKDNKTNIYRKNDNKNEKITDKFQKHIY